jgi:hypothetical protein
MRNTDSTEPIHARRQTKHFMKIMKRYVVSAKAYNRDCNARFLGRGKTDAKRERLAARATEAFQSMIKAYSDLAGLSPTLIKQPRIQEKNKSL